MSIAGIFGPLIFTQVFAVFISTQRGWQLPGAAFLLAALMLLAALAIARRATRDGEAGVAHTPAT